MNAPSGGYFGSSTGYVPPDVFASRPSISIPTTNNENAPSRQGQHAFPCSLKRLLKTKPGDELLVPGSPVKLVVYVDKLVGTVGGNYDGYDRKIIHISDGSGDCVVSLMVGLPGQSAFQKKLTAQLEQALQKGNFYARVWLGCPTEDAEKLERGDDGHPVSVQFPILSMTPLKDPSEIFYHVVATAEAFLKKDG